MGSDRAWMVEQRYRAVREVLDGSPVTEVAARYAVSRQSVYALEGQVREGGRCRASGSVAAAAETRPSRLAAETEALICELRRAHPRWGCPAARS